MEKQLEHRPNPRSLLASDPRDRDDPNAGHAVRAPDEWDAEVNVALRPLRTIELCAGVGGLGLGVHIAEPGSRCVAYVEREAYAAANLVARMEAGDLAQAAIWSDVTTFDARRMRGSVDCVISGDPCQPNSVAGKGLGADDDRFLIEHVVRIFDESGAHRLFRENVTGNADGQLAAIVPLLERLGCRIAVGIFTAAEVGASHRRERLFIMADRPSQRPGKAGQLRRDGSEDGFAGSGSSLADGAGCDGRLYSGRREERRGTSEPRGLGEAMGNAGSGPDARFAPDSRRGSVERIAPDGTSDSGFGELANSRLSEPSGRNEPPSDHDRRSGTGSDEGHQPSSCGSALADADGNGFQGLAVAGIGGAPAGGIKPRRSSPRVCGTSFGIFAPGPGDSRWTAILTASPSLEPAICRMADGLADRVDRLRACGNGVVPLVAAYAWRSLDALLAEAGSSRKTFLMEAA